MDLKKVIGGGGLVALGLAFDKAISFISRIVIAQFFGPAGYGEIGLAQTVLTILGIASLLGLNTGISRFLPRQENADEKARLIIKCLSVVIISSILMGIIGIFLATYIGSNLETSAQATVVMIVAAVAIPIYATYRLLIGSVRGLGLVVPKVIADNIVRPLVLIIGYIVVSVFMLSEIAAVALFTFSFAVPMIFLLAKFNSQLGLFQNSRTVWRKTSMNGPSTLNLIKFSGPLAISAFSYGLISDVDKILLGVLLGTTTVVGAYDVIYPLSRLQLLALSGLGFTILPALASRKNIDEGSKSIYKQGTKWMLISTLPLTFTLLFYPKVIISMTFGESYIFASGALSLLSLAYFSHVLAGPNGSAMAALGHNRLLMVDNLAVASFNVLLNFILIPSFGLSGAVIATVISFVLLNVLMTAQLYQKDGVVPPIKDGLILISATTPIYYIVYIVAHNIFFEPLYRILFSILVFPIIYSIVTMMLVVDNDDLESINKQVPIREMFPDWIYAMIMRLVTIDVR